MHGRCPRLRGYTALAWLSSDGDFRGNPTAILDTQLLRDLVHGLVGQFDRRGVPIASIHFKGSSPSSKCSSSSYQNISAFHGVVPSVRERLKRSTYSLRRPATDRQVSE